MKVVKLSSLKEDPKNANKGRPRGNAMIEQSLRDYGAGRSILLDRKGRVIAGNKTRIGAMKAGLKDVQIVQADGTKLLAVQRMDLDLERDTKARELAVADNQSAALNLDFDLDILKSLDIDLGKFFSEDELSAIAPQSTKGGASTSGNLAAQFLIPPFSVLDARQGYWQERKRAWLALGIESEIGRGGVEGHGAAVPGEGGGKRNLP